MIRIRSTALPAVVTVLLLVGACQDAPSSPRSPTVARAPETQASNARVFSGRSADSVATAILTAWARHGHPEYLAKRIASRKTLQLITPAAARLAPGGAPARVLSGDGSAYKDSPNVLNHSENFYFGSASGGGSIPNLLNASMTFLGDRGRIVASVTVTGPGTSTAQSGTLADGVGALAACADVTFACGTSKLLEGSLTFVGGPYCDAHATGSATYTAQNTDVSFGSSTPLLPSAGAYSGLPSSVVASISSNSAACSTSGNDAGGTGVAGDGGDAPPLSPDPQPAPPAYPTTPVTLDCETVRWYSFGVLEYEYLVCYAD